MNILIVTPFFKQDRNIASVRWTNIATRLAKRHNVIVVTQPHDDMDMKTTVFKYEDNILVARINQKTVYEKFAVKYFGAATGDDWQTGNSQEQTEVKESIKRKIKNRALFLAMKIKAKKYASDIVNKVIPKGTNIDAVISSACPFIEMLFGYELKKKLGCKWISDFRDLPFQEDDCDASHIIMKLMKERLSYADHITAVVPCMKENICNWLNLETKKVSVVTNGFSMLDERNVYNKDDGALHIVHTGSLYGGKRRPDLLFAAISHLKQNKKNLNIKVECAGGNNQAFIDAADKYDCQETVQDFGFLSRQDALELQAGSDCLLAIVEQFSLPAKLFEYILNKKPIICIVIGNKEKSEAKTFIEKLNVGIVLEERFFEDDIKKLADFIEVSVAKKAEGEKLEYKPNLEEVKKYDHENIALQIENIICEQ